MKGNTHPAAVRRRIGQSLRLEGGNCPNCKVKHFPLVRPVCPDCAKKMEADLAAILRFSGGKERAG